ncbi:WYL domain-containing protein [Streptomyces luteogriseus]|uniref:WYL domain-containing protein n=1 Tax=Streptomyces luteogriseus TaxID=68233 RepID=UPI0038239F2F
MTRSWPGSSASTNPTSPPPPRPNHRPRRSARVEPGWTRIALRFRSAQAAETLLALGPDAEVLTPADLRRALARRAGAVVALYAPCQDT